MIQKYKKNNLTPLELQRLDEFENANKGKEITIYLSTIDQIGIHFKLIATTDKPKRISHYGLFDFGNCIDITDYEGHLADFWNNI